MYKQVEKNYVKNYQITFNEKKIFLDLNIVTLKNGSLFFIKKREKHFLSTFITFFSF